MTFPSGWGYKKSHVMTGATGAGTNYQMKVIVHSGSGTSTGDDVYLGGRCQHFPYDIDFADDSSNELSFWVEDLTVDPITVWVKVTASLESGSATIYIFYDNASQTTTLGNIGNTFLFGDDFDGTSLDSSKWSAAEGTITKTVSDGILHITNSDAGWVYTPCTSYKSAQFKAQQASADYLLPTNCAIRWRIKVNDTSGAQMGQAGVSVVDSSDYLRTFFPTTDPNGAVVQLNPHDAYYSMIESSQNLFSDLAVSPPDDRMKEIRKIGTAFNFYDVTSGESTSQVTSTTGTRMSIQANIYGGQPFFPLCDIYWVIVRKYVATEPANTTWGDETLVVVYTVAGITRNSSGAVLVSCTVYLYDATTKAYVASTTSDGTTGAYSFTNLASSGPFFVVAFKSGSPDVMGVTDNNLTASS